MDDSQNNSHGAAQARLERLSNRESAPRTLGTYSRFVQLMRLTLPLAAAIIVGSVIYRMVDKEEAIVPVRVSSEDIKSPYIARNELLNPVFESMDKKGNPYKITADRAIQGEINKDLIMLERPIGTLTMKDGAGVKVTSKTGAYRQDTERFFLEGDVVLDREGGYSLRSAEAHIDLKNNFIWSAKDVKGEGPDMAIDAKGVKANGKTGEIIFQGPAKLVLMDGLNGLD